MKKIRNILTLALSALFLGGFLLAAILTPDKTDSANTADDSQMVLWLGSAALAAAAVVVLTRKKRVSK